MRVAEVVVSGRGNNDTGCGGSKKKNRSLLMEFPGISVNSNIGQLVCKKKRGRLSLFL